MSVTRDIRVDFGRNISHVALVFAAVLAAVIAVMASYVGMYVFETRGQWSLIGNRIGDTDYEVRKTLGEPHAIMSLNEFIESVEAVGLDVSDKVSFAKDIEPCPRRDEIGMTYRDLVLFELRHQAEWPLSEFAGTYDPTWHQADEFKGMTFWIYDETKQTRYPVGARELRLYGMRDGKIACKMSLSGWRPENWNPPMQK
jgi:hypothetical protein